MLNESHNNSNWRNKLNELEGLPGETLNKTAAWGKLHDRLSEKHSNKKATWYWFAAACLLLTVVMSWLLTENKQVPIVKHKIEQEIENNKGSKIPFTGNKDIVSALEQSTKKHPKTNPPKNKNEHTLTTEDIAITDPAITPIETITQPKLAVKSIDTVAVASTLPVKRKLRVVHINELGNTVVQQVPFVRNNTQYLSHPEPSTNEVSGGFSRNASDNILKIKLSPSN